jgi:hypothetical protein
VRLLQQEDLSGLHKELKEKEQGSQADNLQGLLERHVEKENLQKHR